MSQPLDAAAATTGRPHQRRFILRLEQFGLIIVWLLLTALFGALRPSTFLTWPNLSTILGSQAVLDAGDVQVAAHAAGLAWANGAGQRQIIVSVIATPASLSERSVHRARHVSRAQSVLVYARNISMGDIVEASDLQWSDEAVAGPDTPDRAEAVIGMAARLPLRAGASVSAHELVAPKVIRRDQMISIDYVADGISLSLSAKAMGDAAAGDTVQAMNLSSKKVIEAVATEPGHAAVGPGADAARASAAFHTAAN